MTLLKVAALGAASYAGFRLWQRSKNAGTAAFADGQGANGNRTQVRDAGPAAIRDRPKRPWSKVDEESDASFPASDPPANY